MSNKNVIYELEDNQFLRKKFESLEEYSIKKYKVTFKTLKVEFPRNKNFVENENLGYKLNNESKLSEKKKSREIDYNIIKFIGVGAFGKVFKIEMENQYFAVKKMLTDSSFNIGGNNANREIKIMEQLNCEFIVKFYDYWTENINCEFTYIRMELCDETLKDIIEILKNFKPDIIEYFLCCVIFRQILKSLEYLHSMNIMHRDLKPNNILIKYYNNHAKIKLADFGMSKLINLSQDNSPYLGTLKYMAPELRNNNYNNKLDIYSIGIFIKELFENCLIYKNSVHFDSFELSELTRKFLQKINNLEKIHNEMLNDNPNLRPSCSNILNAI